jgi:hypothetical protein
MGNQCEGCCQNIKKPFEKLGQFLEDPLPKALGVHDLNISKIPKH